MSAEAARSAAKLAVRVPIEATWRLIRRWPSARAAVPSLPEDPRQLTVTLDAEDLGRLEAFSPSRYWTLDFNDRGNLVDGTLPLIIISRGTKARARLARVIMGIHGQRGAKTAAPLNGNPLDLRKANLEVVWTGDSRRRHVLRSPAWGSWEGSSLGL